MAATPAERVPHETENPRKIVVDPGFVVDPGDVDTHNQPHNPDQPRKATIAASMSE
jgi:hypothetical protein